MSRDRGGRGPAHRRPAPGAAGKGTVGGAASRAPWPSGDAVAIENVYPEVDCGRFPVKRVAGDTLEVWADVFKPGHDVVRCALKYRRGGSEWNAVAMAHFDNDRWVGRAPLKEVGRYEYTIEAWVDRAATRLLGLKKWVEAGEDVSADLGDLGRELERAAESAGGADRSALDALLRATSGVDGRSAVETLSEDASAALISKHLRSGITSYRTLSVVVDPPRARFAAWYEMFHRSQGTLPGRSATFEDCEKRLPEIHDMGFDVVYLPPIHPIGRTNRRGANNTPDAGPDDPGSPWAIGSEDGGHKSVNPELGTLDDFKRFLKAADGLGMEVAIDLAFQCSPDHPYAREHPEWFQRRRDGTLRYAENPPKRYYDIYPIHFETQDRKALWEELLSVVLFWVENGVKVFRVDNPHTKPVEFWEWLIGRVKDLHPDVLFLAEAFTRPKSMRRLAKLGFSQSYTYFTWKNTKRELVDFLEEFILSDVAEYYRGNLFANTPDILHEYLQKGGRPAFKARLVLAATLSSLYGIYNGYELCENRAVAPGSEEYLDSEKYQYKVWDWDRPGNIKDFVSRVNSIRAENPALQETRNLRILPSDNDNILFYGKWTPDLSNVVLVAVNLDPFSARDSFVYVPLRELGLTGEKAFGMFDMITETEYRWKGERNYVRLDPSIEPANVFLLRP